MANCIGYERISARGDRPIGPSAAIVSGGVACAIFYVDPAAPNPVRWRPDSNLTGTYHAQPTQISGGPIYPGGQIVVAGEGNVKNSGFVSETDAPCEIHCYYFDRVDVLQVDFSHAGVRAPVEVAHDWHEILKVLVSLHNGLVLSGLSAAEPIEDAAE